ncbi:MAG TPA: hypothetical protein VFS51_05210 [Gemmatimonadales bacterium]|nr:hypothetical protein [Gemmatimonadales bacterium]
MKPLSRRARARLTRAAELALLAYLLMAGPVWMVAAIVVLAVAAAALVVALAATRVRLREIKAHDDRVSLYLATHYGSDYAPAEGDEVTR